ncbi:MAG TPA: type II CAAX endopeptidase family protein, partial [Candidatus Saccharibacteria bacterium]|nr:type II CAAX endopeptidase family protein [Candidatus Saccharibacteria bacterium]
YILATGLVVVPLILRRISARSLLDVLGLTKPPRLSMVTWAIFLWGLYFAASLVVVLLLSMLQLPGIDLQQEQEIGFRNLQQGYEFVAAFVALVVVAPLFEEIIFRGYLYGRLRRQSGIIFSMIITSLVFGLVHFQWNVGIDVFVLSLFLCFAREKFDSIWPGVFIHAFKNGIAYTLLFILPLYGVNLVQ